MSRHWRSGSSTGISLSDSRRQFFRWQSCLKEHSMLCGYCKAQPARFIMGRIKIRKAFQQAVRPLLLGMQRMTREEILVLGDSHATVFEHRNFKKAFPGHFFNVVSVRGATVSGLSNPMSKTQAMPIFMKALKRSNAKTSIVLLGEVDTGFLLWYKAQKHSAPVEIMMDRAIENYQNLLRTVAGKSNVICISAPLPTIRDDQDLGEIANLRKEVKATQRQRTELTLEFNRRMQVFCEENGLRHVSLDREALGPDGLVSEHLLNTNPREHHYDREKHAGLIIRHLLNCAEFSGGSETSVRGQ